jgi:cell division protein ZipA
MDGLRWLLFLFGLLVVAGVYVYSRRECAKQKEKESNPDLLDLSMDDVSPTLPLDIDTKPNISIAEEDSEDTVVKQKIVTLRLVAGDKNAFQGEALALNLRSIGMRYGKFGIYHYYEAPIEDAAIFSVANLIEPGTFDLSNIKEQQIPGISIFIVLPGPMDGVKAFDLMISTAKNLCQALNAELLDESGSTLSIQRERYLREEIIRYQHEIMVS